MRQATLTRCMVVPVVAGILALGIVASLAGAESWSSFWKTTPIRDLNGTRRTLEQMANGKQLLLYVWAPYNPTDVKDLCDLTQLCKTWRAEPGQGDHKTLTFNAATIALIEGGFDTDAALKDKSEKSYIVRLVNGTLPEPEEGDAERPQVLRFYVDQAFMPVHLDYRCAFMDALRRHIDPASIPASDTRGTRAAALRLKELARLPTPLALYFSPHGSLLSARLGAADSLVRWLSDASGRPDPTPGQEPVRYPDPPPGLPRDCGASPYALQIASCVSQEVMSVDDRGLFNPLGKMRVSDWVKVLDRLGFGQTQLDGSTESPDEPMTRARAVVSLLRAVPRPAQLPEVAQARARIKYVPGASWVPAWALPYYAAAYDRGLLDNTSLLATKPLTREYAASLAARFAPNRSEGYTGLVIDCRDHMMDRAASPFIWGESSGPRLQVYPFSPRGVPAVAPAFQSGAVSYRALGEKVTLSTTLKQLEEMLKSGEVKWERVGARPLIIPASSLGRSDSPVLDQNTADIIVQENEKSGFLQTWRVGFLVDQDKLKVEPVYPEPNASRVSLTKPLVLSINKIVTDGSATDGADPVCELTRTLSDGGEEPVPVHLTDDRSTQLLEVRPKDGQLQPSSTYHLCVRRAIPPSAIGKDKEREQKDKEQAQKVRELATLFRITFTTADKLEETVLKGTVVFRLPPGYRGKRVIIYQDSGGQVSAEVGPDDTATLQVESGVHRYRVVGTTREDLVTVRQGESTLMDLRDFGTGGR